MSDNYDSGFDLVLSDYERNALLVYYTDNCLPEYHSDKEDDLWYGLQIDDRMFDLNVWLDDMTEEINCTVYECDWIDGDEWEEGYWTTNRRHSWTL
jgi:hypothetical protein